MFQYGRIASNFNFIYLTLSINIYVNLIYSANYKKCNIIAKYSQSLLRFVVKKINKIICCIHVRYIYKIDTSTCTYTYIYILFTFLVLFLLSIKSDKFYMYLQQWNQQATNAFSSVTITLQQKNQQQQPTSAPNQTYI